MSFNNNSLVKVTPGNFNVNTEKTPRKKKNDLSKKNRGLTSTLNHMGTDDSKTFVMIPSPGSRQSFPSCTDNNGLRQKSWHRVNSRDYSGLRNSMRTSERGLLFEGFGVT